MALVIGRGFTVYYLPEDTVRKDLLESMLWTIGVGEILQKGFAKNPRAWLEDNATK